MDRKKYIVEASDDVKKVMAMGVTHGGAIWTDTTDIENLEELNSDYINEHYGVMQDEAYQKGYDKGYADKTNNDEVGKELAKDVYQKGLDDAWEAAKKIVCDDELDWNALLHIFNRSNFEGIFGDFSPSETIAKLKAYEEQKADDEIKVENERMKAKRVMHEDCAFLYWTCSKCNSLVLEHDNFCSNCGADFRRNEDGEEKNNDEN